MRGLLGALLLAPALATALVVPEVEVEEWKGAISSRPVHVNDRAVALLGLTVPSPDLEDRHLQLNFEVLNSEEACGFGNVTLDGQVLSQTVEGDVSSGKGHISTARHSIVEGSWSFYCIKVNGVPDSQLMKFTIESMDGYTVEDVGFSVLFRQSAQVSIMNIETDLSVPDDVVANPNPEALQPADDMDVPHFNMEEEFAELEYLWSQLREIKYLIHEKERALAHHGHQQNAINLKECDSLKCVVKAVAEHAKNTAHKLYGKIRGESDHEEGEFDHSDKPHFKHPKFPKLKNPFKGGKNHTCGPPKHGKGNHTMPPPPWKKPHHPLPICRYPPPPPFHHGPPPFHQGPPPHHRQPHGKPPGGPDEFDGPEDRHHHMSPPDFFDGPPPHRHSERPEFDGPERHQGPPDFDGPHHGGRPNHYEERPDFDRPHHHEGPPDFDGPPQHGEHHQGPPDFDERPSHHHEGPPDFDGPPPPHHGDHHEGPPPEFDGPPPHHGGDHPPPPPPPESQHKGPPGPPPHDGPPHAFDGPGGPPRHNGLNKALQITKFTAIGFLFAFLLLALHRRNCTPKRRADRAARKERRRAYRRAAHKHLITRLLDRLSGADQEEGDDYEEKRERLLSEDVESMGDSENGTTMIEDIREMRTTADVAAEMISADSQPPIQPLQQHAPSSNNSMPTPSIISTSTPLLSEAEQDYELSLSIQEEELPAYEDNDGSEMGSVVADGFRYTPGSSNYSPAHSVSGSVSDILGPDVKN